MDEDNQWQIAVAGAVVHLDSVLMVRHTYGVKLRKWALPGGWANPYERLDQAVVREIGEETGIDAEVIDIIAVSTHVQDNDGIIHIVFRLRPLAGTPVPDNQEVDQAKYITADEIVTMTDEDLFPIARNVALAALQDTPGLVEDDEFPLMSTTHRGFLIPR